MPFLKFKVSLHIIILTVNRGNQLDLWENKVTRCNMGVNIIYCWDMFDMDYKIPVYGKVFVN